MKKFVFAVLTSITLTSCFGFHDYEIETIVDDYEVLWIDIHQSRSLKKVETLVPAFVFATGYNSKYIYSKQHPLLKNSKGKINLNITHYYIIERTKSIFQDKPIFGPFNKMEFEKKCKELAIKKPEFNLTFPTEF
ncbi:hypothetical protein AAYQ05_07395 [Flavobacterium sp. B11]|uniref:hypothetical protein n=1 Tax=Flavobacterium movens TaxID=214860 RepID=UPI0031DC2A9B